jgi:dTMP kinase
MSQLVQKLRGKFLVFDGPEGSGKNQQINRLKKTVEGLGLPVAVAKDPGGTDIGDRIRNVLLNYDNREMDVHCETLLFMASRAQLVKEVVRPALQEGKLVLGDRFISATCAYQVAGGFGFDDALTVGRWAVGDTWPDLTIVLDVPVEVGFKRIGRKPRNKQRKRLDGDAPGLFDDHQPDSMELRHMNFHQRVRKNFLELPGRYPRRVEIIDGTAPADVVAQQVLELLERVDL